MSFANLPPEIFHLILGYLICDQKSLSSLCAVDRRTYSVSYPLLYQSVTLVSHQAVSAFCQAHVLGIRQPIYSPYLTVLNIGPKWRVRIDNSGYRLSRDHAPYLRRALRNLENLKSLSLSVTPKALILLLNELVVPFKLESFVHSGRFSAPLLGFLEGQPLITHLGWHGTASEMDVNSLCKLLESNITILPKLEALDGPLQLLTSLLLLRPISRITITQTEFPGNLGKFIETLQRATGPITRLCVCEDEYIWPTWTKIALMAQSTCLPSTLKQLYIAESPTKVMYERLYQKISVRLLSSTLASTCFGALEKFELTSTYSTRWHLPPLVCVHGPPSEDCAT
ncbi:hypothetical protein B0J17DRAFT_683410 [Rhizoctonia solani]|nr:hypothetical protein B0J17DRAFT_683410 [Rhizoctonia solani]